MEVAKEVTSKEVIGWILAALDAAKADTGGEGRQLSIIVHAGAGGMNVEVVTWNPRRRSPGRRREYGKETTDGVLVVWVTDPPGIPTGSVWLPEDFVKWVMGGR